MEQLSFAQAEYARKRKVTRRERFLAELHGLAEELYHLNERAAHYDAQIDAIVQGDRKARIEVGGLFLAFAKARFGSP